MGTIHVAPLRAAYSMPSLNRRPSHSLFCSTISNPADRARSMFSSSATTTQWASMPSELRRSMTRFRCSKHTSDSSYLCHAGVTK
jgi:hypothetical protein